MKYLPFLIAMMWATGVCAQPNTVTTPPCTDEWCVDAEFNYFFCDPVTGKRKLRCSSDPNNETDLAPQKQAIPLALCPELKSNTQYSRIGFAIDSNPLDPTIYTVFDIDNLEQRLAEAAAAWARLCPSQGPDAEHPYCCLRIRWSTNPDDMHGYPGAPAVTHAELPPGGSPHTNCQVDCNGSEIVINQNVVYTDPDRQLRPRNFLYTESNAPAVIPTEGYAYVDAYSMFLHELGHWLGFSHSDGEDTRHNICEHTGSIMEIGSDYPAQWINRRRDLSPDDVCMFKKLYCCGNTTKHSEVAYSADGPVFAVLPNPARHSLVVKFSNDWRPRSGATLRLVDNVGATVLTLPCPTDATELTVNVSTLPTGTYMLVISEQIRARGEKVMLGE